VATEEREPTIYELRGDDGVQVTYATRYPQGPGWLLYAGPQGRHAFSPGEIDVRDTELGREVTVTLKADDDAVNLTVLIPPVHLDSERAAPFETLAVVTTMPTSPDGASGSQDDRYEALPLVGRARLTEM
jgi:hypothetical protein